MKLFISFLGLFLFVGFLSPNAEANELQDVNVDNSIEEVSFPDSQIVHQIVLSRYDPRTSIWYEVVRNNRLYTGYLYFVGLDNIGDKVFKGTLRYVGPPYVPNVIDEEE